MHTDDGQLRLPETVGRTLCPPMEAALRPPEGEL